MTRTLRGYTLILLSAVGFGSYGVWTRLVGPDFGVYSQAWVRSLLILAVLVPVAVVTKSWRRVDKGDRLWIWVPVAFGVGAQVPLYYAYNHMSLGAAMLILYGFVVLASYIIGRLFLGEAITAPKVAAMVMAGGGLFLVFGVSLAMFSGLAVALAAINGIAAGGELATTKKSTDKYSPVQMSIYLWAGVLITHLPPALILHDHTAAPALTPAWAGMAGYAVAGTVSVWLVIEGYKHVEASIGSLIGLSAVLFGAGFGALFFGERLTPAIVWGGLLILGAAILPDLAAIMSSRRQQYHLAAGMAQFPPRE